MSERISAAINASLAVIVVVLAILMVLAFIAGTAVVVGRRRHLLKALALRVPIAALMPRRDGYLDEDVKLVKNLFATWHRYTWARAGEPPSTVAYTKQDADRRWRVFIMFDKSPFAAAHVTLPDEPRPLGPSEVSWYYTTTHPDTTAYALINVTADSYGRNPIALPASCRAPDTPPKTIYVPNGSA